MLANPTKWITERRDTKSITYTGEVVGNNDPLKLGRIQVRISEFYGTSDEIPDEDLPWINQQSASFLGSSETSGFFAVPDIGTQVTVEYPTSDPYFGYYKGGNNSTSIRNTTFDEDYPNTYGFVDPNGTSIKVNKTTKVMTISHEGITFTINPDKTINVSGATNITTTSEVTIQGDCVIGGKSFLNHTHTVPEHAGNSSTPN